MIYVLKHVITRYGDTNEVGARAAMTRRINDYARRNDLLKKNDDNLEGTDIREGLTSIISVRISEEMLQFEGQKKGRLGTAEARTAVVGVVSENLVYYLEENTELTKQLIKKAMRSLEA